MSSFHSSFTFQESKYSCLTCDFQTKTTLVNYQTINQFQQQSCGEDERYGGLLFTCFFTVTVRLSNNADTAGPPLNSSPNSLCKDSEPSNNLCEANSHQTACVKIESHQTACVKTKSHQTACVKTESHQTACVKTSSLCEE